MRDTHIILTVAVLFPLFGLGVFFFWRWTYGVWAEERRQRRERAAARGSGTGPEVVIVKFPSEPVPSGGVHPSSRSGPGVRGAPGAAGTLGGSISADKPDNATRVDGRRLLDVYAELRERGPRGRP